MQKQKEKEEEEKAKKKEHEEEIEREMRERLARKGYSYREIERILEDEKAVKTTRTTTTTTTRAGNALVPFDGHHAPVYAKVHRDFLSVDTLKYYDVPWEYDKVRIDLDSFHWQLSWFS